jgi:hypothetical protein
VILCEEPAAEIRWLFGMVWAGRAAPRSRYYDGAPPAWQRIFPTRKEHHDGLRFFVCISRSVH